MSGIKKHNFLERENFYESKSIGTKARSDKRCEHCGQVILKGTPHLMMHFYPEFDAYPIHKECEDEFMKSLN